jgi:hypothetical protein
MARIGCQAEMGPSMSLSCTSLDFHGRRLP